MLLGPQTILWLQEILNTHKKQACKYELVIRPLPGKFEVLTGKSLGWPHTLTGHFGYKEKWFN